MHLQSCANRPTDQTTLNFYFSPFFLLFFIRFFGRNLIIRPLPFSLPDFRRIEGGSMKTGGGTERKIGCRSGKDKGIFSFFPSLPVRLRLPPSYI